MNRKGFTLVELLGVIVLISILSVVIIPKISNTTNNGKKEAYNVQVANIKKGASDFIMKSSDVLSSGSAITIKLGALKQAGYLPVDIKNPITRKSFSNDSAITISFDGANYDFNLNLFDVVSVDDSVNINSPIIVLNGNYIEYVEVFDSYQEKGATARSASGDLLTVGLPHIKLNNATVLSIDTSHLNTYSLTYEATDSSLNSSSAVRTVIVRDSISPSISVPKETILRTTQVGTYDLMNEVVVTDNFDSNPTVTIDSNLSNIPGKYVLSYKATDSSGNFTIERRVINVVN